MTIKHEITVNVNFPALDALVDYLTTDQQKQVDAVTASVTSLTSRMRQANSLLQLAVKKAQQGA